MSAHLRILCANLWNGKADPEALARLLREEEVDIACLQELSPEQAEAVAEVLPHGELSPTRNGDGIGTALRAPAKLDTLPLRRRSLLRAGLEPKDWPGLTAPLAVWNLHVWAPHDQPPLSFWIRRAQLRQVLAELASAPRGPLVLAGDFNATPIWPVYRRLAAVLDDAARACAGREGKRPQPTWAPWPGTRRLRLLRLDHVFTRDVEVQSVRRLPVRGSDHDGLCADLSLG